MWISRIIVAAVLIATPLASCDSDPDSDRGRIAFTSRRGGWFSVYTVRPDGTDLEKLVDIVAVEDAGTGNYLDVIGQPAWSHDGTQLAFVCPTPNGHSGICVVDSDGSSPELLYIGFQEQDRVPAWSPDDQIAFARQYDNSRADIFLVDSDGSYLRQLTHGHFDYNPSWSPSGEEIAFLRRVGDQYDIYVVVEDDPPRVLKETDGAEGNPAYAPDGERLAYILGEPDQDIYVMDLDTLTRRNVTRSDDPEGWPTWSPDGRRLAFMCGPGSGICVINADGTGRCILEHAACLATNLIWPCGTAGHCQQWN